MARTGTIERPRIAAWLVVAAVHAGLAWLLLRAATVRMTAGDAGGTLQLAWIPPAPPAPPPATGVAPSQRAPRAAARRQRRDPAAVAEPVNALPPAPPAARPGLSAVFLEQARHLAPDAPGGDAMAADPFADRRARLPGREAHAFRMREPRSIQGTLRKVGALLGGAGYTTDPCPRIRENVAALGNGEGAERELLAEELRRQRAYCH